MSLRCSILLTLSICLYQEKLEGLGTKPSQEQILSLLRLLKFVESVMFAGNNPLITTETIRDPEQPSPEDVEMIILDLL